MSYFDEMIRTERIENSYEKWEGYRRSVTDYIEKQCKASAEACSKDGGGNRNRPGKLVLALWGIGQAADIDIGRLAQKYKLVLVDRNRQAMERAVQMYGLDGSDYVLADIPFWNVENDDYRLYEAMLEDGVDAEHVLEFLTGIAERNSGKYIGKMEKTDNPDMNCDTDRYLDIFDHSVAVGLHSQLNSRFAALLYHYRENYHDEDLRLISSAISGLNMAAVERLNDYMYHMTKHRLIYGYEAAVCERYDDAEELAMLLDQNDRQAMQSVSDVEGVVQLMKDMSLHVGYDVKLLDRTHMVWPFDTARGKKNYVMGFAALEKSS